MSVFFDIYDDLPRKGPGNGESTRKAYSLLLDLAPHPNILDIGCGNGPQTIELAKITDGFITAVDNCDEFISELEKRALNEGLSDKIKPMKFSMADMAWPDETFDIIWAESSIYIIGFENGLKTWRKFLNKNGYMVVSELSWINPAIPDEPRKFWEKEYQLMNTVEKNLKIITSSGYIPIDYFVLPESAWWDEYYTPLEQIIKTVRAKYKDSLDVNDLLNRLEMEINLYRKYSEYYGYVFYIMQK